jgi:hypothetical protein
MSHAMTNLCTAAWKGEFRWDPARRQLCRAVPTAMMCSYKSSVESSSQSHNSDIRLHAQCLALLCMPLCALQNIPTASSSAFTGCNKALRCHRLRQHHQHTQPEPARTIAGPQLLPGTDFHANSQGSEKKSPVQMLSQPPCPLPVCLPLNARRARDCLLQCCLPQQLP